MIVKTLFVRMVEQLRRYLSRPSWFSEIGSGIATLGWGLLALNVDSADDWPSASLLFQLNKTPMWGLVAVFLGLGQIFLFQVVDRNWRRPWLRWTAAMLVAWIWGAITIGTATANPWPPGIAAYFGWWIVNIYLIGRIFGSQDWTT